MTTEPHNENRGPERSDSVKVMRFDRALDLHQDKARESGAYWRIDETTGFLHVRARTARTGVQTYSDAEGNTWGEYRDEQEVFSAESMASFASAVITDDHPPEFVTSTNVSQYQKGHADGAPRREGRWMVEDLIVTDAALIAKMQAGKVQISKGYFADVVPTDGRTDDGQAYKYRQTNIRGNHTAVVDAARAGPECRALMDSLNAAFEVAPPAKAKQPMSTKTIQIDGTSHELPSEIADAIEAERTSVAAAHAKQVEDASRPKQDPDVSAKLDALQAKVDMLEEHKAGESARVDARAELLAVARKVCPDFATTGVEDSAIRRQVVLAIAPGMEAKLDANPGDGYLKACFDHAIEGHAAAVRTHEAVGDALGGARKAGSKRSIDEADDIYRARMDRFGGKTPAKQEMN